jgi:hypothetical protein
LDGGVQLLKGIDGVRRTVTTNLQIGDREASIAVDSQAAQLQSVVRTRIVSRKLVRRRARGDQQHPIQLQLQIGLLRANEMAKVRRVKRAAENSDADSILARD